MSSVLARRGTFREACVALAFGALGTLLQLACGGSSHPPPVPVISSFTAAKSPITTGTSTTLTAVFSNGSGSVNNSVGTVNSGTAATVSPTADTTYTLTVTNSAGVSVTATTPVAVVAAPVATSLVAGVNPVPYGGTTTVTPTYTGGTGSVDQAVGPVTSGTGFGSGVITAAKTFLLTVTNAAGTAATTSVTLTPQTVVVGAVTPAAPIRTAGTSTTFSATATGGVANTLTWTASAGTMNPATGAWTAPTSAQTVTITATSADDASKSATTNVTVAATPLLPVISAPTTVIAHTTGNVASLTSPQAGMTFTWGITGGTITSATTGASITFTAGSTGTVALTCTATNAAGAASAAAAGSSTIVPAAPTVPVIAAPAFVSTAKAGNTASVASPQPDMTFAWSITNGTITSASTGTSVTFTAGTSGTVTLRCTATNSLSVASTAGTATSAIVPYATISIISATPEQVASGGAATLSCAYSGGTGAFDHGVGAVLSGGTAVVHPAVTTTYTLTVTNPAGDPTTDTVRVTVPVLPRISAFKTASATITAGQGTLLSFSFTGDGAIDHGVGSVTSGNQIAVTPTVTTTYTLTATNFVGATVTAAVTVTVKAFTGKFVYVANAGGGVSGYALNDATGALTELANSPFDEATAALHVTTDPAGKFLFVVNGDGVTNLDSLTVFSIDQATGDLSYLESYATGVDPWTCAVDPSGQWVYVRCDSSISAYALDATTGELYQQATTDIPTAGGSGEVLIHPSGTLLFTVGRTSDQLEVFTLDPATGTLSLDSTTTLPAGAGPLSLALNHTGEYLFTKSEGASGSDPMDCVVYGYHVNVQTGGLLALAPFDTHLQNSDAWHGVSGNPTQSVIYITLVNGDSDYAAYAFNVLTGTLTALPAATYDLFDAAGSDSLVVSRNGKWAFLADYNNAQIAVGAVNPTTGVITAPTFKEAGQFPVSITVVGTVQ